MGTVEIASAEYLRAVEFATKTETTHTRRMERAYGSHLRTITNGKLAEVACHKHLKREGLTPNEDIPDFRIFSQKKHRDTGDLSYLNERGENVVIDVKAAESYSSWLMVKEADLCMGVLPDAFVFCTPNGSFVPKRGGDYGVEGDGLSEARRNRFRKFFYEYPDVDFGEPPTYTVHGGARLRRIVSDRGNQPSEAIGPLKYTGSGKDEIPPYSEHSEHYSEEEYEKRVAGIRKVAKGGSLDNYNRFLHTNELKDDLVSLVRKGGSDLEPPNLRLFFEEASEDVGGELSREKYLRKLEEDPSEPGVESVVREYQLVCEVCGDGIRGADDREIMVGGERQTNLSDVKVAGIARAFFGEELCFGCIKDASGQGPAVRLEI